VALLHQGSILKAY